MLSDGVIPGQFSTLRKYGEFNNEKYHYPYFESSEAALWPFVDQYHKHLVNIKEKIQKPITLEVLEKICKVATFFLFGFLKSKPFSDGNGRLGHLLCSHVLGSFSSFSTGVYNIFSSTRHGDYVQPFVNARKAMNDTDIQEKN